MDEREWLDCGDPEKMLVFVGSTASSRKLRLFGVACRRRIWHLLPDERSRRVVEVAEQLADLLAGTNSSDAPAVASRWVVGAAAAAGSDFGAVENAAQADLLRDIFNPFCTVTPDPAWLTPSVVKLAQVAYEERQLPSGHLDTGRLAVLADALEEAGCHDQEILGHLRGPGRHVRGCWPVDLLLQKG